MEPLNWSDWFWYLLFVNYYVMQIIVENVKYLAGELFDWLAEIAKKGNKWIM